jgi:hypothetical protein
VVVTDNQAPTMICAADQTQKLQVWNVLYSNIITVLAPTFFRRCWPQQQQVPMANNTADASGTISRNNTVTWIDDGNGNTAICTKISITDEQRSNDYLCSNTGTGAPMGFMYNNGSRDCSCIYKTIVSNDYQ